jgi:hypothetical protein
MMKLFLLVAGVFLFPVALSYGIDRPATLPKFMNITVEGTDQTHIFRALMGLYLGMVTFCIIAAFTPEWRRVAVIWAALRTLCWSRRDADGFLLPQNVPSRYSICVRPFAVPAPVPQPQSRGSSITEC